MKTAVSIPDELFKTAEATAKRLGIPRSQLFAKALEEFIRSHDKGEVTTKLNTVYPKGKVDSDHAIRNASLESMRKSVRNDSW